MKKLLPIFLFIVFSDLMSQVIPHEYLIKYTSIPNFNDQHRSNLSENIKVNILAGNFQMALIEFPEFYTNFQEIEILNNHPSVISFQANHTLQPRFCCPNDPEFNQQWNLTKMGFEDV